MRTRAAVRAANEREAVSVTNSQQYKQIPGDVARAENQQHTKKARAENRTSQDSANNDNHQSTNSIDFFPRPFQAGFELRRTAPPLHRNNDLMTRKTVVAHFDGANRGNGLARKTDRNQKAAIGIVFIDEESGEWVAAWASILTTVKFTTPDGNEHQLQITGGNNRAEMIAHIELLEALVALKEHGAIFDTAMTVGDSAFTLSSTLEHKNDGLFHLRSVQRNLLALLKEKGVNVEQHRVDREYNANADEACNAALDNREFNRMVKPLPLGQLPLLDRFDVAALIHRLTTRRERMWRTLPTELRIQFQSCVALLLADAKACGLDERPWLLLAPSIFLRTTTRTHRKINALKRTLLMGQSSRVSRVMLVSHFLRGIDTNISHIFPDTGKRTAGADGSLRARVHGHVASRAPGKALKEADSGTILDNTAAVHQEWKKTYAPWTLTGEAPQQLPSKLPGATPLVIEKDEVFMALKQLKSLAAPGKNGWCKELMLGAYANDSITRTLLSIVNSIIADDAGDLASSLLLAVGVAFQQDKKVRTCGLRDFFVKLAWRAALNHSSLKPFYTDAQMMGERNGALRAARWAQRELDDNRGLVLGDAVNAHPSFSRKAARDALQKTGMTCLFSIFNFTYCQSTQLVSYDEEGNIGFEVSVSRGQLQGCTSAGPIFSITQGDALTTRAGHLITRCRLIADDVAVTGNTLAAAEAAFEEIASALATADINIRGPKRRAIARDSKDAFVFGGAVIGRHMMEFPSLEALKPLARTKNRVRLIMDAQLSNQDALLLTQHTSKAMKYFLGATSPRISLHYAEELTEIITQPIKSIVDADTLPDHALRQIFTPIVSGGLGLVDPQMAQQVYDDADNTTAANAAADDINGSLYEETAVRRWKELDGRGSHFWSALELLQLRRPWFTIFPTSKPLNLLDGAVSTTLQLYLNIGQKEPRCVNPGATRTSPNMQSLDHSIACHRCGGPWWKIRHNEGLAAFFATAQHFNVAVQADVGSLLGTALEDAGTDDGSATETDGQEASATKKRPDGYLVLPEKGNANGGANLVMFDFTCVHISALGHHSGTHPVTRARYLKIQKYRKVLQHVKMVHDDEDDAADGVDQRQQAIRLGPEVVPIVMTTFGFLDKHSAAFLERVACIASRPGFTAAATAAIQVRLLNAQATGVASTRWRLNAREAQGATTRVREASAASQQRGQAQAAATPNGTKAASVGGVVSSGGVVREGVAARGSGIVSEVVRAGVGRIVRGSGMVSDDGVVSGSAMGRGVGKQAVDVRKDV